MKNRMIAILAALLLIASAAGASNFADRFSLRLSPGGILPWGASSPIRSS